MLLLVLQCISYPVGDGELVGILQNVEDHIPGAAPYAAALRPAAQFVGS